MPGAGLSKMGNLQCVRVARLDSYYKILTNAVGAQCERKAEHGGIILSGRKGEQTWGKAAIGIMATITMASNFSFPYPAS